MSEALPIELGKPRIPDTGRTWTWVVDQNQVLKGWLTFEATDNEHWEDIISPLPGTGEAATLHTSLKDALSLMLSAGMKVLPVVDASGRLLGEISMDAIEVLIKEGDHHED